MNFFGMNEEVLSKALPLAKKRVLIYMHGRPQTFGPLSDIREGGNWGVSETEGYLKKNKYAFRKNIVEMQFGQPFKTLDAIHAFLTSYGDGDDEELEKKMMEAEDRIIKTNRFDYPYYLPKSISVALFIISASNAAQT
jgi:hypothetical protein